MIVVGRALEHQVLEQVREPRAAAPLVLGADVVPQVHRHDRQVVVLVDDDVEAVAERAAREGNVHQRVVESLRVLLPQVDIALP